MKKLIFFMLGLLLLAPATNSFSDSFYSAGIWEENRYYDDTKQSEYFMMADAIVDTNAYNVFVNIPSWAGSSYPGGEYQKPNVIPWFGNFDFTKHFKTADGYPSPGNVYANIDFNFFIDTNDNGVFDSSSDPYKVYNAPSGIFSPLPFVDNVNISYVGSNTIVSWNGIPLVGNFGDDGNDSYKVRIINRDTGEFVYDSGTIAINSSNQYNLNLGDLSVYGENLWVAIEAREGIGNVFIANRSRYYASASPVPEPATLLLLGAGIVGLAGFGRKRFKK